MTRVLWIVILVSLSVFLASVGTLFWMGTDQSDRVLRVASLLLPDQTVDDLAIPGFSLTDQEGRPATEAILIKQTTIVNFMFTRCTLICPTMTAAMLELQDRLKGTGVRFLSITVDPIHDTSEILKTYALERGGDLSRWSLLTGNKDQIWAILREGLRWGISEDPSTPITATDGTTMANINHPGWFALVGPDGRVLGIYKYSDAEDLTSLENRARAVFAAGLLPEPPR